MQLVPSVVSRLTGINLCPCGSIAITVEHYVDDTLTHYVECSECWAQGPEVPERDKAIKAWNAGLAPAIMAS